MLCRPSGLALGIIEASTLNVLDYAKITMLQTEAGYHAISKAVEIAEHGTHLPMLCQNSLGKITSVD